MLLLRGETRKKEKIEFYFNDITDVYDELGVTLVTFGNDIAVVINETVIAVANNTDPMVK